MNTEPRRDTYQVPLRVREGADANIAPQLDAYEEVYGRVREDPDAFWLAQTRSRITWRRPPTRGLEGGYASVAAKPFRWFADGILNVTESCVDRHLALHPLNALGDRHLLPIFDGDGRLLFLRQALSLLAASRCCGP